MNNRVRTKVVIISTGGTIATQHASPHNTGPSVTGRELLEQLPEIEDSIEPEVIQFSNIPSDYFDPQRWSELRLTIEKVLADADVHGVVVTHGTDTLAETAFFLDLSLNSPKPVVCTGAQRLGFPNTHPTATPVERFVIPP